MMFLVSLSFWSCTSRFSSLYSFISFFGYRWHAEIKTTIIIMHGFIILICYINPQYTEFCFYHFIINHLLFSTYHHPKHILNILLKMMIARSG